MKNAYEIYAKMVRNGMPEDLIAQRLFGEY